MVVSYTVGDGHLVDNGDEMTVVTDGLIKPAGNALEWMSMAASM